VLFEKHAKHLDDGVLVHVWTSGCQRKGKPADSLPITASTTCATDYQMLRTPARNVAVAASVPIESLDSRAQLFLP
jgi:hypothetical protein